MLTVHLPLALSARGLDYVENRGQWPAQVRYRAALQGGALFLTDSGFTYTYYDQAAIETALQLPTGQKPGSIAPAIPQHAYRVDFLGAAHPIIEAPDKQSTYHNYFLGSDSAAWAGGVPLFARVTYRSLYPGTDLQVHGSETATPKYDFILSPGADPAVIRLGFEGVHPVLTAAGDLELRTSVNTVVEKAPYAYQEAGGVRRPVPCRYRVRGDAVSFDFPQGYDRRLPLVIDPTVVFATYSGSTGSNGESVCTYDATGRMYVATTCFNAGWPATTGAFQTTFEGVWDIGVNVYNPTGTSLLYASYYGGSSEDRPISAVVNAADELFIAGRSFSADAPTMPGCYDATYGGGGDVVLVHFNPGGTALLGATYVGGIGSDGINGNGFTNLVQDGASANFGEIILEAASGDVVLVTGTSSPDFPVTAGAFQTTPGGLGDACLLRMNAALTTMVFSTYLGGSDYDWGSGVVQMAAGTLAVCGGTASPNFPTTPGALSGSPAGATDGFAAVLDPGSGALLHATYLGTADHDVARGIQVGTADTLYLMGHTSGVAFPVSAGAYTNPGGNVFLTKLTPTLSANVRSTRIGVGGVSGLVITPSAFMRDNCGSLYFCGYEGGWLGMLTTAPLTPGAYQTTPGNFWLAVLSTDMNVLEYATYIGRPTDRHATAARFDPSGTVYLALNNCNGGTPFATTAGSWSPLKQCSGCDAVAFKMDMGVNSVQAGLSIAPQSDSGCAPYPVQVTNTSTNATSYLWNFGDGSPTSASTTPPLHTYTSPGTYTITLVAYNSAACTPSDTARLTVYVLPDSSAPVALVPPAQDTFCEGQTLVMHLPAGGMTTISPATGYTFLNDTTLSFAPAASTEYTVAYFQPATACSGEQTDTVRFTATPAASPEGDFTVQASAPTRCSIELRAEATSTSSPVQYAWYSGNTPIGQTAQLVYTPSSVQTEYCLSLVLINESGCTDTVRHCVPAPQGSVGGSAQLPTAFTPNGDGLNDRIRPVFAGNDVVLLDFSIYNRWGQRVFSGNDKKGWDGRLGTTPADAGTYFYHLSMQYRGCPEVTEMKGDVTLVR